MSGIRIPKLYRGKDKTFFFLSYERTGTSKDFTSSGQTITEAERGGDFSNCCRATRNWKHQPFHLNSGIEHCSPIERRKWDSR